MKRGIKTSIFLQLRRWGLLCKKPIYKKPKLRIKSTVYPPEGTTLIDAKIHHHFVAKKLSAPNTCKFDVDTLSCECGITKEKYSLYGCGNSKHLILG